LIHKSKSLPGTETGNGAGRFLLTEVFKPPYLGDAKVVDGKPEKLSISALLLLYGTRKGIMNARTSTGTTIIYTVPEGKFFFLTSLHLALVNTTGANELAQVYANLGTADDGLLSIESQYSATATRDVAMLNPCVPIRFVGGDTFKGVAVFAGATLVQMDWSLIGYEIDTKYMALLG
jgi:hypothetical protein